MVADKSNTTPGEMLSRVVAENRKVAPNNVRDL
jgi:hypothetical protein